MNKYNIPVITDKNYYIKNSIDHYNNDFYTYYQRIFSNDGDFPVIRSGIRLCIVRKPS